MIFGQTPTNITQYPKVSLPEQSLRVSNTDSGPTFNGRPAWNPKRYLNLLRQWILYLSKSEKKQVKKESKEMMQARMREIG